MPEIRTERPHTAAPRLLDRLRDAIRVRHYSPRTAEAYVYWTRKFIVFHGKRHPDAMGAPEVKAYLTYLAVSRKVASSTQNQALAALLFLYGPVLGRELQVTDLIRARKPVRVPVTLSPGEVARILQHLRGLPYLATIFMYGAGLRLMECLQLRVQDLDFAQGQVIVREGKGGKDRRTLLPAKAVPMLRDHLAQLQHRHNLELKAGGGDVFVPDAVSRRFPGASTDWAWQWVFPASRLRPHAAAAGARHHLHKTAIQRAFALAVVRSGISKGASCHSLRHSFARELIEASYDIRTIQELMGHKDVSTTMIYTSVLNRGGRTIRSPLDAISTFAPHIR